MTTSLASRNRKVALLAGAVAIGMIGVSFAAVPLYSLFCQATGFGGTTQRASRAPTDINSQQIAVRFDANIAPSLPWTFNPVQQVMVVNIGEQALAHYEAVNTSSETITGTAAFNVSPPEAGIFFNKIECFCFTEQTLKPGARVDLPVSFFVDPAILDDPDTKLVREITLSYTFYPASNKSAALK